MSQRSTTVSRERESRRDPEPNTLMNALVGAVVTVVGAPLLPFSALFGGAVAGYMQRKDGAKVGAISGAIAAVPALFVAWLFAAVFFFSVEPMLGLGGLLAFVIVAVVLGYLVLAGALGGLLGVYVRNEL